MHFALHSKLSFMPNLQIVLNGFGLFLCMHFLSCQTATSGPNTEQYMENHRGNFAIVIHGGAGNISKERLTTEQADEYYTVLQSALKKGMNLLESEATALDVVETVIQVMEDSPLFNAGKGAVFTHEGINELDASIMSGINKEAGAVGGLTTVKNPISAAKAVMAQSEHVMLSGSGADQFAKEKGLEIVDPEYFYVERRRKSLDKILEKEGKQSGSRLDHDEDWDNRKFGTVGCVVLDVHGNLAAGTSTGGMTNKRWNRIGDSPIIGAGTYADNETCAVSCTGHGEFFIRYAVAYDLSARMKYAKETLDKAANKIIHGELKEAGGSGGLIAVDRLGNISMPFNTTGMFRGYANSTELKVGIWEELK